MWSFPVNVHGDPVRGRKRQKMSLQPFRYLWLLTVLSNGLLSNAALCPPRIDLPGYRCKCNELTESWVAHCSEELTNSGRQTSPASRNDHPPPETVTQIVIDTKTQLNTNVPPDQLETTSTDSPSSPGLTSNPSALSGNSVAERRTKQDATHVENVHPIIHQHSNGGHNDVENSMKRIDESRGGTVKREERIAYSRLVERTPQNEHLVKMQVHGARTRRAQPPSEAYFQVYDLSSINPSFSLRYYPGTKEGDLRALVVTCGSSTFEIPAFLTYIGVGVDILSFSYCPMPRNVTYAEMLRGNDVANISQLNIDRPKLHSSTMTKEPFENLSKTLQELQITYTVEMATPLRQFEDDFFADFPKLELLSLRSNAVSDLRPLRLLPNLAELSLGGNPLIELNASTFANLDNLRWLQLSGCSIKNIRPETFAKLTKLEQLNLSLNDISTMPSKAFSNCRFLKNISMDSNNITKGLPEDLFEGLADSLVDFSCHSCHLPSLPRAIFHNVPKLKTLRLGNNRIRSLHPDTFNKLQKLVTLDMPNNDLVSLDNQTFEKLVSLEVITLSENDVVSLPDGMFDNNGRLKHINVEGNYLTSLPRNLLRHQLNLQILNLADNNLSSIPLQLTAVLKDIVEINLSHNLLTDIPPLYTINKVKLRTLDLSFNRIQNLSMEEFISTSLVINLNGNPIETVKVLRRDHRPQHSQDSTTFFSGRSNGTAVLRQYLVDSHQLRCDCHLLEFYNYLRSDNGGDLGYFDKSKLFCSNGKMTVRMVADDFICDLAGNEGCPSSCTCFSRPSQQQIAVNCTNVGLGNIAKLPLNVTDLELQHNNFTDVPDFSGYESLRNVNLSHNSIRDISNFLASAPSSLRSVSFQHNFISHVETSQIPDGKINFDLELSGNSLRCDCNVLPLKSFIAGNIKHVPDSGSIVCSEQFLVGENQFEDHLNEIDKEIICPRVVLAQQRRTNIVVGITIAFAVLLILAILIYYKNKQRIKVYLYIYFYDVFVFIFGKDELGKDKRYDAFISYSEHDHDVMDAILQELEQKDPETGEPEYKFCVHGRDFAPTYPVVYNILNAVQNSRRTILVLSEKFVESTYFNVELSTALSEMVTNDRSHRLIIVLKGEKPPEEKMDKDLRKIIDDFTYIKWDSPYFWNNLRYALPHKRPRRKNNHSNRTIRNELDHPMHLLNKNVKPSPVDVARLQEQLENERNRLRSAGLSTSAATSARPQNAKNANQTKTLTGQVNEAFDAISTNDINVHCDSFRTANNKENSGSMAVQEKDVVAQESPSKSLSARHRPNGVTRPPRRKDKEHCEA